jgi:hypothetical protein
MQAVLSDGSKSIEVVISTLLSHLVSSNQIVQHSILRIKTYQYNITDDNIHIVSVSAVDILEEHEGRIGEPVSVMDSMHKRETKEGNYYFNVDDDEWEDGDVEEEPLSWSLDDPSAFCDWTIEVTHLHTGHSREQQLGGSVASLNSSTVSFHRHGSREHHRSSLSRIGSLRVETYHVHKAILSVGPRRSEYFATLFKQSQLSEHSTNTSHINLEESAAEAFPGVLDYIYSDKKIKFTSKNATAVRHLAHYFGVRPLWKYASVFIKGDFGLETAATYLSEAILYHDEKLEQASIDILAAHIEEVSRRALTKLPPSSFERIVTSPHLKCRSKKLSDIVLKYCQTQGDAVDMPLLMKWTKYERMPSVSRKAALPLLKIAVAREEQAGVNLANTDHVLRARCVEACVEEWKETLAKPLLGLENRDKNISRILGCQNVEHRDLPKDIQIELLEKALCAAKIELDDVKAELLYREEQIEELTSQVEESTKHRKSSS